MKKYTLTLLLVISLFCVQISILSAAPETPTPEAGEEMIAFPIFDPARKTYDIYLARPDGSDLQKLIEDASQPAISPDGTKLAFRSWIPGKDRGLFVRDLTGERIDWHLSPHPPASRPSWASNGQFFLLHSRQESDRASRVYRSVGADVLPIRRPDMDNKDTYGEMPALIDDTRFVYKGCEFNRCGLFMRNIDGTSPQMLTEGTSDTAPAASPDGKMVAFMAYDRDKNWEVYVVNIDGTGLTRLTKNLGRDGIPTWSPDGKMVVFASERDGTWGIWAINPDGTDEHKLFDLPGSIDGHVRDYPDYDSMGWIEERISWCPNITPAVLPPGKG
ncbi:MAG: TolB family protein [Anaerolineae bacterium]